MSEVDSIRLALHKTKFWHGTGRYQYSNGRVIDVLVGIINAEAILPREDLYSLGTTMQSVSAAKSRDYGLLYADMHSPNPSALKRNTPQRTTVRKYVAGVKQKAILHYLFSNGLISAIKLAHTTRHRLKVENRWSKKINKAEPSILKSFTVGSDISGNYPILIGISDLKTTLPLPPYLSNNEVRVPKPIALTEVTHFEVPEEKLQEVETMIKDARLDIQVIAIEAVESAILIS